MSIKKIAEKAGVSISTVSRILNRPDYKCSVPGLREKVWSIAMEMNYVPNEAARNLKKGTQAKESKIWYINVLMTRTDESRTDPFFTELLRVVESEIHEHNCILSKVWYMPLFSDDRKCRRENLDQIIQRMYTETEENKDGLIIIGRCNPLALKSEDCPTGIYCANDITAVGILKYLRKCRNLYFTPSIIASDDIEEAQFTKPMLTTVGLPKEEMGRFALYLLLDRMKGGHSGVVRMELSGKLLVRNSCSHVSESFWSDYCI